jgi:hypothetical protein
MLDRVGDAAHLPSGLEEANMRRIGMAAALVWALAGTAMAADTPRQFDLSCTGTIKDPTSGALSPWSMELSVDLKAKTWCVKGCDSAHAISRIEPDRLWLRQDLLSSSGDRMFMAVDRTTGGLTARDETGHAIQASCALAPFTRYAHRLF